MTVFGSDLLRSVDFSTTPPAKTHGSAKRLALALLARVAGLPELCTEVSSEIVEHHASSPLAWGLYVQSLMDRKRHEDLDAITAVVQRTFPAGALSLFLSARQKAAQADPESAIDDLERLLRREPGNSHVRYTLSQLHIQAGQTDAALALLEDLARAAINSTLAGARANTAMSVGETGSIEPLALSMQLVNDYAWLLAHHRPQGRRRPRLDEAYRLASLALRVGGDDSRVRDTLGWIEHLRGHEDNALAHLSRALGDAGASRQVHQHLGTVYKALGMETWARYHFDAAAGRDSSQAKASGTSTRPVLARIGPQPIHD